MTNKMPEPANDNRPVRALDDADLDHAQGGSKHSGENLYISSTDSALGTAKHKSREIVVVGSKIKEVVRTPGL